MRVYGIVLIGLVLITVGFGRADGGGEKPALEIFLPAEASVEGDIILLGKVGKISGKEELAAKAKEIGLGQLSAPGQEIAIDRPTILGRLACNGISASLVELSGAEKVTVRQQQRIIKGEKFVESAESFLKNNFSQNSDCQWQLMRMPKNFVVAASQSSDVQLVGRLSQTGAPNQAVIQIAVLVDGKEVGTREVTYRLKCSSRAKRPGAAKPPIVIERNRTVIIRFENPGLEVTAIGKSMQEGRAGEYIRVKNNWSQKVIVAKVNQDGTVEPVL